jgi:hypothetical protein
MSVRLRGPGSATIEARVRAMDWMKVYTDLDAQGWSIAQKLLTSAEAGITAGLYDDDKIFRSRVIMARHGFGRGEYKYFGYPLPLPIQELRTTTYPHLASIANQWHARMRNGVCFPKEHAAFLARCREAGQTRPAPLLLRYGKDDYNCLHRDLYGAHVFPIQMAILLDEPGDDFTGGEFVMTEQRPRMQSRAMVLPLKKGDAAIFAVNSRPVRGTRGDYQVKLNHGVSKLYSGRRHALGLIFHDAA